MVCWLKHVITKQQALRVPTHFSFCLFCGPEHVKNLKQLALQVHSIYPCFCLLCKMAFCSDPYYSASIQMGLAGWLAGCVTYSTSRYFLVYLQGACFSRPKFSLAERLGISKTKYLPRGWAGVLFSEMNHPCFLFFLQVMKLKICQCSAWDKAVLLGCYPTITTKIPIKKKEKSWQLSSETHPSNRGPHKGECRNCTQIICSSPPSNCKKDEVPCACAGRKIHQTNK